MLDSGKKIQTQRMNLAEIEAVLAKVSKPLHKSEVIESISITCLPLSGFLKGLVPMLLLLSQRFIGVLSFIFLPTNQAILVAIVLVVLNLVVSDPPKGEGGFTVARPFTLAQARITAALEPFTKYEPPFWCFDNHWSTLLPLILFNAPPKPLRRQRLTARDGAGLGLDWFVPAGSPRGVILALPGLNGSSQGGYVVDLMENMGKQGFIVAVSNGRGVGRTGVSSSESIFHMGRTADLLECLEAVEDVIKGKDFPIYVIGYSAGGIRGVKFAAVYGKLLAGRVAGIVSFGGVVRNIATPSMRMSTSVYQPVITHAYAATMYHKLQSVSGISRPDLDDMFTRSSFTGFRDFDARVTAVLHSMTIEEYEQRSFAYHDDRWRDIAIPTLIVNAVDDPVLHIDDAVVPEMALQNSYIMFLATKRGGHIGWPTGLSVRDGYRWMSDVALSFMNAIESRDSV